jgi:hypothetical protein
LEKRSSRMKRSIKRKRIAWIGATALLLLSASLTYAAFKPGEEAADATPSAQAEKPAAEGKEEPTVKEIAEASDEELVDEIHYYNEISLSKESIRKNHHIAVKIVDQKAKEQNVKPDLDNPRYREIVKETALDLEGKSPEEQRAIAEFAKEADRYENKANNKRIKELQDKAKKEGLTEKERAELINLLPIKNPGPKLKPEPKGDDQKNSTPPEDKIKTPGKGEKDKPGSDNGDSRQDENGTDEQDGKTDGSKDQPKEEKQKDGSKDDEKQKDGHKDQPDGKQKEKGKDEPQDGEQPGDGSDEDQDGNGQDGDDDGDKDAEEPAQPPLKTEANGYNRAKAVEYAYKWWNKRNNEEYGYYSRSMGGCYDCWYDCTNFVSQVIKTGGIKERVGRYDWFDYWFYNDDQPSLTWGLAHSFYKHMKSVRQAQNATLPSDLQVGDIISVDFEGDGDIDHSVVITKIQNGQIYATYHSSDNKDKNITDWLLRYDVYAWKMETVKNNY